MKRKSLILLVISILISISILGCGSIKIQTAKDTRGTKVKVGYMPNYGSLWSILNAIELGYMRDANILVELIEFEDGPSIINALENGDIDIIFSSKDNSTDNLLTLKQNENDTVTAVMSGNFVQRGEPAILDVNKRTIIRNFKTLLEQKYIERVGANKNGYWKINKY